MNKPTIEELQKIGFTRHNVYYHDQFTTTVMKNGCLQVDFTIDNKGKETVHSFLDEVNDAMPLNYEELKTLNNILNNK